MKKILFNQYTRVNRVDLVTFSQEYLEHRKEIERSLRTGYTLSITLMRLKEETISTVDTHDYTVIEICENGFTASFIDPTYEPPLRTKVIRWDNPLAEIPTLPGWNLKPITLGNNSREYADFIKTVKTEMANNVGKVMILSYQNDDGSVSNIKSLLIQVNKGNFLGNDITEKKLIHTRPLTVKHNGGKKNHRFISENGFLYSVQIREGVYALISDDEEVFGEE